ncbi:MAG: hypothetical protein ABJE95_10510 [Byssovorax sp.]
MLEIILLRSLYRKLSAMAVEKGRPGSWGWLGVLLWVGGEFLGFIIGSIMGMELGAYGIALLCAATGAGISYAVVNSLGSLETDEDGRDVGGVGRFDPENPYSPPGTMNKR